MNDGLKQRVVGAIVLLVLAVIVLPMLFEFSDERRIDRNTRIPERPTVKPVDFEEAKRPDNIQSPKPVERVFQPDDGAALDKAAEQTEQPAVEPEPETPAPALNDSGMLAGWVIQVGAFKDTERADKLEQSLLQDGYKAYQQENRNRGLFFIYIGPEADKGSLLKVQKKIDSKYRVKSKILVFEA